MSDRTMHPRATEAYRQRHRDQDEVEEQRVMRVMVNLITLQRLEDGGRSIWMHDIEKEYRRRYRRPSTDVPAALERLERKGMAERNNVLTLYRITLRPRQTPSPDHAPRS